MHFKCSGLDNWGKAATALSMIADAKARGLDVDCDCYPYEAGSNPLKNLLPPWVQAGGVEAMLTRLAAPATREKIRADIAAGSLNSGATHSELGLRDDFDLAASAAAFRPHHSGNRRRAFGRSGRAPC